MLKTDAMLKAGVIIGQVNCYEGKTDFIVTKDLENPIKVSVGEFFRANGYIKLKYDDLFEIELKSGDIDVKELHIEYEKYKNNCESLLKELEVSSIEEAKLNKEKLDNCNRSIKTYNDKISELLGEDRYETLKEKLAAFGDRSQVRSLDVIEGEMVRKRLGTTRDFPKTCHDGILDYSVCRGLLLSCYQYHALSIYLYR